MNITTWYYLLAVCCKALDTHRNTVVYSVLVRNQYKHSRFCRLYVLLALINHIKDWIHVTCNSYFIYCLSVNNWLNHDHIAQKMITLVEMRCVKLRSSFFKFSEDYVLKDIQQGKVHYIENNLKYCMSFLWYFTHLPSAS